MKAKLVVIGGDTKTKEVPLHLPCVIGRGREATLTLPHALVSRQHCEVYESNGGLFVRDLGSLNGTFVANQRITESPLPDGALLTVGTVTFRAVYEEAGEALDAEQDRSPTHRYTGDSTIPVPQAPPASVEPGEATLPHPVTVPPLAVPLEDSNSFAAPPAPEPLPRSLAAEPAEPAAETPDAAEEDDDLSEFFDSLK